MDHKGESERKRTFAFRISGYYAGAIWQPRDVQIELLLPEAPRYRITMNLPESRGHDDGRQPLVFLCGGFENEEIAQGVGARLKHAVLLAAVTVGLGIDLGSDEVVSSAAMLAGGQPDERLQPQVHGLQTFPELEKMLFGFAYVGHPQPRDPAALRMRFEATLKQAYSLRHPLMPKEVLAAQLYADSHFVPLHKARLLLLISAVEALADAPERSAAARELVEKMMHLVSTGGLDPLEKEALSSQLGFLKWSSIRSTCRRLVRAHCDEDSERRFLEAYAMRSALLHKGEAPSRVEIGPLISTLGDIVQRIILGQVNQRERG